MREIGIMEVGGFRVGHAQNEEAATGCTVLLCDRMSPAGLDVRGGGPASRESQLLSPVAQAEAINGVLLSGGSAFGLDAAGGVQQPGIGDFQHQLPVVPLGIGIDVGDLHRISFHLVAGDVRQNLSLAHLDLAALGHLQRLALRQRAV